MESVAKKPSAVGANARGLYYLLTRKFIDFDEPEEAVNSLSSDFDEGIFWKKTPEIGEQLIAVSPNPANDFVELRVETWQSSWNATLTLENALGSVVHTQKLDAESVYVPTADFSGGVYFARLKDANGHLLSVQKLIIAHN